MPAGDVWILGAGASAEAGAPTISTFQDTAKEVASLSQGGERETLDAVITFWQDRLPAFNIEEFFGFVDSEVLPRVTQEGSLAEMKKNTIFLIAKVVTQRVHGGRSQLHIDFVKHVEDFVPIITLNWDILLDMAILERQRTISYVIPKTGHWNPYGKGIRATKLLKLHGSLNWVYCRSCESWTFLTEKEPVVRFLLRGSGIACKECGSTQDLEVRLIPPVLSKLDQADMAMQAVWEDAYKVLKGAERVVIIGYSFPPTDIQTKIFIAKALREAKGLKEIKVVTRPKFGSAKSQFEDRYTSALEGSEKMDCLRFDYRTFGQLVASLA